MGMAASQARLLTITSRIHDVEYQAQSIQNAKIALATQSDDVYKDYIAALDQTTFTIKDNNNQTVVANFNTLCGINAANASSAKRYLLKDDKGRLIVSNEIAEGYKAGKDKVNNAYEFAMFMMEGQPEDFSNTPYNNKEKEIFDSNCNNIKELESLRDKLTDSIYQIYNLLKDSDSGFDALIDTGKENPTEDDYKTAIKENLFNTMEAVTSAFESFNKNDAPDNGYTSAVSENYNAAKKLMDGMKTNYQTLEHKMYTMYNKDIYEGAGNNVKDFNAEDFWYYVNMYKQIEANGGRIVEISEFDGLDGIGDAATDSDWLKNAVQSGKITIDISNLDSKGVMSFNSTGVPSDSNLEYTTTTTIDKAHYAKAEAEYEHKTKQINQQDKKYDMDLKKLETERSALTTEYESVKKVTEDNVKRTFGIFS